MTEKDIQKKIMDFLKKCNGVFFKFPAGAFMSRQGVSDILGCYDGRFVAIEVKSEKGNATKLQRLFIDKIRESGGIAGIVRSVDDVIDLFAIYGVKLDA